MKRTSEQIHDEWLVLRSQAGDAEGFRELFGRWHKRLWRHVMRLTDGHEDAADIVQEIWMTVVRKMKKLEDPACFPAWVYRIATARSVDWVRRQKRRRNMLESVAENRSFDADRQYDDRVKNSDLLILRRAIGELPTDQRTILTMFYLEELSILEIAVALAVPAGTVKSRLHSARNHLRNLIERRETK